MCSDQAEIDRYWSALSRDGEEGPCGWLKDRFGVSWQVVPREMAGWLTGSDDSSRDRVFQAVLEMKKIDIQTLRTAAQGG